MSKLSKILICILLISSMLITGCDKDSNTSSQVDNSTPTEKYQLLGHPTYSPVKIPYIIDNPLEIETITVQNTDNHRQNYFQIKGLIDQEVQAKVNEAIKALFDQMIPYVKGEKLPPYRGIQTVIGDNKPVINSNISIEPSFNCNNVLSVLAYVSATYSIPNQGHIYVSLNEALNFDLNTGKTFLIEDVFTNDSDGLEVVNQAIMETVAKRRLSAEYDYGYDKFSLVAPFRGIKPDQKFYLSNNGLYVLIDYNNPEFDLNFFSEFVVMPLNSTGGNIAITERFYDQGNTIFVKEPFAKRFIYNYHANRITENDRININGIDWMISTSYPRGIAIDFVEKMDQIRVKEKESIIKLHEKTPLTFVENSLYINSIGKYVNISNNIYTGGENGGQWSRHSYMYLESGEAVGLEDIFAEGYDYRTAIKTALAKAMQQYGVRDPQNLEMFLEDIMFEFNDSNIAFVTKPYQWDKNSSYPITFILTFEEIGYHNLKIFD